MKIGNIKIKYPIFLAPMAGVTDRPTRIIFKRFGASVVYTEFVSSEGIIRENIKTLDMIKFSEIERPIGVQIFGDNPTSVSDSAKYIYDNFKPDIIDINFGCPVPKITKKGAGSAALRNLDLMNKIVSSVIEKVPNIPITAKMRSGWDRENIVALDAGEMLQGLGVKAITLHARTTKQSYTGFSDWELIAKLKKKLNIPVIGNGDVDSVEKYLEIKHKTKCDGVMIGRGALGNPWIFKQIIDQINHGSYETPNTLDKLNICIDHILLLEKHKNSIASINLSKKHINFYLRNFNGSSNFRKNLMVQDNIKNILNQLEKIRNDFI